MVDKQYIGAVLFLVVVGFGVVLFSNAISSSDGSTGWSTKNVRENYTSCVDTDGGSILTVFGTVTGNHTNGSVHEFSDFCINSTYVMEQTCAQILPAESDIYCGDDTVCEQGACRDLTEGETLCRNRFDDMVGDQSGRLVEEIDLCAERNPTNYSIVCVPFVNSSNDLQAPEQELWESLARVEEHLDDKFDLNCDDPLIPSNFYEPACSNIDPLDMPEKLRQCLFNTHILPLVEELIVIADDFGECEQHVFKQSRIALRDWIQHQGEPDVSSERKWDRRETALTNNCQGFNVTPVWADIRSSIESHTVDIRDVTFP